MRFPEVFKWLNILSIPTLDEEFNAQEAPAEPETQEEYLQLQEEIQNYN